MARRTGVPTLLALAKKMCQFLARYTVVIQTLYPGNQALQAALTAANAACAVLATELELVREYGD